MSDLHISLLVAVSSIVFVWLITFDVTAVFLCLLGVLAGVSVGWRAGGFDE